MVVDVVGWWRCANICCYWWRCCGIKIIVDFLNFTIYKHFYLGITLNTLIIPPLISVVSLLGKTVKNTPNKRCCWSTPTPTPTPNSAHKSYCKPMKSSGIETEAVMCHANEATKYAMNWMAKVRRFYGFVTECRS